MSYERKQQGMTQEQLAEFSDLTVNYLSKIERGIAKKVSAESLYRISQALNVSMESFFTEEKTSHQQPKQGPYEKLLTNYFSTLETNKTEAICKYLLEILKLSAS
ncbi:helix-turn-helix transcriptional regulator [Ligilactobacillus salivarius]|uniref:helix-turn-helix domain-containing protein n=1 Tax=Ligilactobacillus salivarius TaxID=1624 RepID=UPI001CDC16C4